MKISLLLYNSICCWTIENCKFLVAFFLLNSSLIVNANEIEYVGLGSHISKIAMSGEYQGEKVIGLGGGTKSYKSEKLSLRLDQDDSIKYLMQRDVAERDLIAYSKVTFGPLTSYLPIQTNSTVNVSKLKVTAIKSFEFFQFGNIHVIGGLGGSLQELKISVNTEKSKEIEGYLIMPTISLMLNYKNNNDLSLICEYRLDQDVNMLAVKNKSEEVTAGGRFRIDKSLIFGVYLFQMRDLIRVNDHSKGLELGSVSKGIAFSTIFKF